MIWFVRPRVEGARPDRRGRVKETKIVASNEARRKSKGILTSLMVR